MSTRYAIELDDALAGRLEEAARNSKLSAAALITECIIQHLEVAIRHRALIDRLDTVDQGLLELATFIGAATAGPKIDLSNLCQYSPAKK